MLFFLAVFHIARSTSDLSGGGSCVPQYYSIRSFVHDVRILYVNMFILLLSISSYLQLLKDSIIVLDIGELGHFEVEITTMLK